jgi:hypothetical protein
VIQISCYNTANHSDKSHRKNHTKTYGKLGFCVDYRALNKETIWNIWPILRTDGLIDPDTGSHICSVVTLSSAYYQILTREPHISTNAFVTLFGCFKSCLFPGHSLTLHLCFKASWTSCLTTFLLSMLTLPRSWLSFGHLKNTLTTFLKLSQMVRDHLPNLRTSTACYGLRSKEMETLFPWRKWLLTPITLPDYLLMDKFFVEKLSGLNTYANSITNWFTVLDSKTLLGYTDHPSLTTDQSGMYTSMINAESYVHGNRDLRDRLLSIIEHHACVGSSSELLLYM